MDVYLQILSSQGALEGPHEPRSGFVGENWTSGSQVLRVSSLAGFSRLFSA